MLRPAKTWIVVADGARARFLTFANGRGKATTIPGQIFSSPAPPTHELGRSRPPRAVESVGHHSHGIEPRVDLHENLELEFLKGVVRRIEEAYEMEAFEKFVLVAPPKALGHLRTLLDQRLKAHMLIDVDLDLTKHTDEEISRLVVERLGDAEKKHGSKAVHVRV
jgi:protein required for attachment to host cells